MVHDGLSSCSCGRQLAPHASPQEGCCQGGNLETAIQDITELICDCFFNRLGSDLPAATRWYTFSPHLSLQAGCFYCHGLLRRVLERAFVEPEGAQNGDEEAGDDFHASCNRKIKTSLDFVREGEAAARTFGTALLGIFPADALSNRLQHLDYHSNGFTELTAANGLLQQCLQKYWFLDNPWHESSFSGYTKSVLWFMEHYGIDHNTAADSVREVCVSMAAAVWSRIVLGQSIHLPFLAWSS